MLIDTYRVGQKTGHWRNFTLKSGGDQWRRQDLVSGGHDDRGAEGAEWRGVWGEVWPQSGGERGELSQRGPGRAPAAIAFSAYLGHITLLVARKIRFSTLKKW